MRRTIVRKLYSCLAVTVMVGALTTGCNRPANTPDYEARVKDNLKTANLDDVKADWKADEKALHLSGEVERAADKARAEELAQQVVGTSGRVVNEVKVAGSNSDDVDKRIENDLDRAFKEDDQWDRDTLDLTFKVKEGVVTITGSSPTQAMKDKVGARVKTVDGVKDVVNDLEIKPAKANKAKTGANPRDHK
jgi:BON domain-containing protein